MKFQTKPGTRYLVIMGSRALGTRSGEVYRSDGQNLTMESTGKKTNVIGPIENALRSGLFRECEPVLPYPLVPVSTDRKGRAAAQRYEIPESDRAKVLKLLWPFGDQPPKLDEALFDLHAGKRFQVGNFLVYREEEANFLVSPYYPEGGGTVIDWMPADWDSDGRSQTQGSAPAHD